MASPKLDFCHMKFANTLREYLGKKPLFNAKEREKARYHYIVFYSFNERGNDGRLRINGRVMPLLLNDDVGISHARR